MITIGVIGSRKFEDYYHFSNKLMYFISNIKDDIQFVSGGCKSGADNLIKKYCIENGYNLIEHLPDYEKYKGKVAPLKRNHKIVDDSDMLIAFWNEMSKGTEYTIKLAQEKGIPIRIVKV